MAYQIIVVGAGLAGLLSSILLRRSGLEVLLLEKSTFPFHRVCGEYISHEVTPFLKSLGLYPASLGPSQINTLQLSSVSGRSSILKLPLGGFGISRYALDHFWYKMALEAGVQILEKSRVSTIIFEKGVHSVKLEDGRQYSAAIVVGAFGKRSKLDRNLQRPFFVERSPYVGIKYHLKMAWEQQVIALHAFKGGYCGVCQIEEDKLNFCYLTHRDQLKKYGEIEQLEKEVLKKNPHLCKILDSAITLFPQPLVINEVSFAPKQQVVNHILMAGDAAGMIAPLCGNGMAMAIRSAYYLCPLILKFFQDKDFSRQKLESTYSQIWRASFSNRLKLGRGLQKAFHLNISMHLLVQWARWEWGGRWLVAQTHGKVMRATGNPE